MYTKLYVFCLIKVCMIILGRGSSIPERLREEGSYVPKRLRGERSSVRERLIEEGLIGFRKVERGGVHRYQKG